MDNNYVKRQNEPTAIKYYKASLHCIRKEKVLKFSVIAVSILLCLAGIIVKMIPEVVPRIAKDIGVDQIKPGAEIALTVISFTSGFFLIVQMVVQAIVRRMHIEGVNIQEKYDNYVYGLTPNETIMRPIPEALIDNYSTKIKKPDYKFYNRYWQENFQHERNAVFNNQRKLVYDEYQAMIYVKQRYFNVIWIGFFVLIFACAFIINTRIQDVLLSIFFPSISAISIVVSSWIEYSEEFRYLQSVLACIDEYQYDRREDLNKESLVRNIQDSIFADRLRNFTIPSFMKKSYYKHVQKLEKYKLNDHRRTPADAITMPLGTSEAVVSARKKDLQKSSAVKSVKAMEKPADKNPVSSTPAAKNIAKPVKDKLASPIAPKPIQPPKKESK